MSSLGFSLEHTYAAQRKRAGCGSLHNVDAIVPMRRRRKGAPVGLFVALAIGLAVGALYAFPEAASALLHHLPKIY
jgi:hypothetical protein